MSTKNTVFAISLASAFTLVTGLFITSEVRACSAAESELPVEMSDIVVGMLDQGALEQAHAFNGEWVFIGGQKERDGVDAGIAAAMDAVNPMLRNMGTRRLKESNPVPSRLSIAVEGDNATIKFDGNGHKAKLDGTPVKATSPTGQKIKVSHSLNGTKLIEFLDGTGGDRHNRFTLNADGTRLTTKVKITSSHLPVPVEYRLTFKRK